MELEDALVEGGGLRLVAVDLLGDEGNLGEQLGLPRRLGRRDDHALVELLELLPAARAR